MSFLGAWIDNKGSTTECKLTTWRNGMCCHLLMYYNWWYCNNLNSLEFSNSGFSLESKSRLIY
jgi:hypothetical protein